MPPAVPALGHDVSTEYRTHPVDLSAQKLSLSAPILKAQITLHCTLCTTRSVRHTLLQPPPFILQLAAKRSSLQPKGRRCTQCRCHPPCGQSRSHACGSTAQCA